VEGKTRQPDIVIAEALSERYGWTPAQIREQRVEDIRAYVDIIDIKQRLHKKHHGKRT
jgi:hypothetical protein